MITQQPSTIVTTARTLCVALLLGLLAVPQLANASGGFSVPTSGANLPPPAGGQRQVDEVYEHGKAIYLGRQPGTEKINYCVVVDGKPKKIRGRTLRSYKGASMLELANALYNCAAPQELALNSIDRKQIPFVMYYLNKRYKLDLSNS